MNEFFVKTWINFVFSRKGDVSRDRYPGSSFTNRCKMFDVIHVEACHVVAPAKWIDPAGCKSAIFNDAYLAWWVALDKQ